MDTLTLSFHSTRLGTTAAGRRYGGSWQNQTGGPVLTLTSACCLRREVRNTELPFCSTLKSSAHRPGVCHSSARETNSNRSSATFGLEDVTLAHSAGLTHRKGGAALCKSDWSLLFWFKASSPEDLQVLLKASGGWQQSLQRINAAT